MGYRLLVMGYGLWVIGYWLWVIGYGLWVIGYWLLAIGYRLLENKDEDKDENLGFARGFSASLREEIVFSPRRKYCLSAEITHSLRGGKIISK